MPRLHPACAKVLPAADAAASITGEKLVKEIDRLVNDTSYRFNAMRFRACRPYQQKQLKWPPDMLERHVLGDSGHSPPIKIVRRVEEIPSALPSSGSPAAVQQKKSK